MGPSYQGARREAGGRSWPNAKEIRGVPEMPLSPFPLAARHQCFVGTPVAASRESGACLQWSVVSSQSARHPMSELVLTLAKGIFCVF